MSRGLNDQIIEEMANRYYPVGEYMITTKNVNPNTLGVLGTWQLTHKKLDPVKVANTSFITWASTSTPQVVINHCDGYFITISVYVKTSQTLSDTTITLGNLNIDAIGSNILTSYMNFTGWLHTLGACQMNIQSVSSTDRNPGIQITEVWHRAGTRSFTSTSNIIFDLPIILSGGSLLYNDNMCNEFFWLRTA